jgi:CBS domain-containing protein
MAKATVREAMTSSPRSIETGASVVDAARLMANEDVGSLPVVEGSELVGMVTDRDLVVQVLAKNLDPSKVSVSEVASENPVVASPEDSLDSALQRMAQEQVRRLPVVEDGRLVGILAQADVARTAKPDSTGQMVEQISEES